MTGAEYLACWLKSIGLNEVFGVQGGAVVHLFDACERMGPKPIYCHHEQAAGFAAVAYARIAGFGACIVTTGPGSTNALTPLLGAWQDSTPCLFIAGQVRSDQRSYGKPVRQIGTQEAPISEMIVPITKADAWTLQRSTMEHLYETAVSRRPGPVWLEIPQDVLWTEYESN